MSFKTEYMDWIRNARLLQMIFLNGKVVGGIFVPFDIWVDIYGNGDAFPGFMAAGWHIVVL